MSRFAETSDAFEGLRRRLDWLLTGADDAAVPRPSPGEGAWAPRTDVYESDEAIVLEMELPGLRREDVDIRLTSRALTVTGVRPPFAGPDSRAHAIECWHGRFSRSFSISTAIDPTRARASLTAGVLRLEIPKAAPGPARRIEVHDAGSGDPSAAGDPSERRTP